MPHQPFLEDVEGPLADGIPAPWGMIRSDMESDTTHTHYSSPLVASAYHEAGHAVMAHLCGQHLTQVEIIGDEEHSGSVSSLRLRDEPEMGEEPGLRTAAVEARILCVCAGIASEQMVTGTLDWDEGSEDVDAAVRLAMRIVGDCERVLVYLEEAREHAEFVLRRHWAAVETLANALLLHRSMTGQQVRAILEPILG